jgi:hypothetical protein
MIEIKLNEKDWIVLIGIIKLTAEEETFKESLYLQQLAIEIQGQIINQKKPQNEIPPTNQLSEIPPTNQLSKRKTPFKELMIPPLTITGITASKTMNKHRR